MRLLCLCSASHTSAQIFSSESSRKVVWDEAAVAALMQQFDAPSEDVAERETAISRVLSNFKVRVCVRAFCFPLFSWVFWYMCFVLLPFQTRSLCALPGYHSVKCRTAFVCFW